MEAITAPADIKPEIAKGNGNMKRKHGDVSSDDENDFLGFDKDEQSDSHHMKQNIKKICTDSSSDEMTPKRQQLAALARTTDILDPAFKIPFKYGWKRELVLRAEPTMSKEKGEVYYIMPSGKKLRTRHEIMSNLHDGLTINNFTLVKEAIGASSEDEIIRPAKFYNYTRRSNVDPVIAEASPPVLGKRVPKPKMPKGASPPPTGSSLPTTPTSGVTLFTPNHNKSFPMKENVLQASAQIPTRKPTVKGKLKGDARCTIHCPPAIGKVPSLQCKVCLCLYHHECAKKPLDTGSTSFTCENCNFKFAKASQHATALPKKHHQQQHQHNFEKNPQTIVTVNGNKFIVFESGDGVAKKVPPKSNTLDVKSAVAKEPSTSSFNFSANFMQNSSAGFLTLLHTFQYLKVHELQRASRVCQLWNAVAHNKALWRTVRMKNSHVNDWDGFIRTLNRNGTVHLDLRKVLMGNQEDAWREFSEKIGGVSQLKGIDLCRCQSTVVEGLFKSNPELQIINAVSLKDEKIDMTGVQQLQELRLRTVRNSGITLNNFDFTPLVNIRHLSLTTVGNLNSIDLSRLQELESLESLELGNCDEINSEQFSESLARLNNLQRLRIEKGSNKFNINKVLTTIGSGQMPRLAQLELINVDVKHNFVESIKSCTDLKRLLVIPTYVSQSAATNFMVMNGVMRLTGLDTLHWLVTNELLRVTELYLDQSDTSRSEKSGKKSPGSSGASTPVRARDCIPVLKPVPGKEDSIADASNISKQQVEIVPLKTVETILQSRLTSTTVKLLKISFEHTWRQVIENV